jgi:potassium-dependent mechanosensitive channel
MGILGFRPHGLRYFAARSILIAAFFSVAFGPASALAQGSEGNANSAEASPTPPPSPTPIPLSNAVTDADAVAARLRVMRTAAEERPAIVRLANEVPALRQRLETLNTSSEALLSGRPSLEELRALEREWQSLQKDLSAGQAQLRARLAELEAILAELGTLADTWKRSLALYREPAPDTAAVPAEVLSRTAETVTAIDETRKTVEERRSALLALQSRISDLESVADDRMAAIAKVREQALANLFWRDAGPIWAPGQITSFADLTGRASETLTTQFTLLRQYVAESPERFALHGLILLLLTAFLYWARTRVRGAVEKEPKLEDAAQVFEMPVVTALIVSAVATGWIYPQAPRLLSAMIGAAAIVPGVILLRRLVDRPLYSILNALVVLYFVDRIREVFAAQPFTARLIFAAELVGAILFLLWFLKTKSIKKKIEARHYGIYSAIRRFVPIALAVFGFALAANIVGYVSLSAVIGNGVLGSAYAALVIYVGYRILTSLLPFLFRVTPLARLSAIRNNRSMIREGVSRFLFWVGVILWILVMLNQFAIREAVLGYGSSALAWSVSIGTIAISVGDVLLFAVTIWVAVWVSRFVRFFLEEDVYPRVDLGGGVTYAVSTTLHYLILVGAFLFAIAALGVDFTKFALIGGAVGIGIGFGLQNIINNFVSGMILLFERPVKVGDVVQIGEFTGTLQRVGLRASVLRQVDGSDVIVPNSHLISEEVINWTMTDKQRRVDIPVGVAYGTDAAAVLTLLNEVIRGNAEILTDPEPKALFLGFGDNSLDFELRFWTDSGGWVGLRSEVMAALYDKLNAAGIEIPFPQRDLHLRSIDPAAAKSLTPPK